LSTSDALLVVLAVFVVDEAAGDDAAVVAVRVLDGVAVAVVELDVLAEDVVVVVTGDEVVAAGVVEAAGLALALPRVWPKAWKIASISVLSGLSPLPAPCAPELPALSPSPLRDCTGTGALAAWVVPEAVVVVPAAELPVLVLLGLAPLFSP
jgi:hypothetical protein